MGRFWDVMRWGNKVIYILPGVRFSSFPLSDSSTALIENGGDIAAKPKKNGDIKLLNV